MKRVESEVIIQEFQHYLSDEMYPCVAARAAMSRKHIPCLVADHMGCPQDDQRILEFLYHFVDAFRKDSTSLHSAVIIFKGPEKTTEEIFDTLLWQRLQALSQMDAMHFAYDKRVNSDPSSADFSFSIGEEAFFIIGLHTASSRRARQFKYPSIVFNPHAQFEELRKTKRFEKMKKIVRQRDTLYSGSVNPMLASFGESSEVYQYSGRQYDDEWICPLKVTHAETDNNSPAQ